MEQWRFLKSGPNPRAEILDASGGTICDWNMQGSGSWVPTDEFGRLMALAPELLLLCQRVADLSPGEHGLSLDYVIRQAREVVTKAKGEPK